MKQRTITAADLTLTVEEFNDRYLKPAMIELRRSAADAVRARGMRATRKRIDEELRRLFDQKPWERK